MIPMDLISARSLQVAYCDVNPWPSRFPCGLPTCVNSRLGEGANTLDSKKKRPSRKYINGWAVVRNDTLTKILIILSFEHFKIKNKSVAGACIWERRFYFYQMNHSKSASNCSHVDLNGFYSQLFPVYCPWISRLLNTQPNQISVSVITTISTL